MFDVLTIAAIADELSATLLDGRIQRIGLVDDRTVAAEVYAAGRRRYLITSADDRAPRLHLTSSMPSLDPALTTPFGLLLRKYLRGGVVIGIDQPPLERLVRFSIAKRLPPHNGRRRRWETTAAEPEEPENDETGDETVDGEGDATYLQLAVELMGRHSNLILIDDDGRIMESIKRVTPSMSRVRPIQPRLPYVPPPPVDKPDPRRLTTPGAEQLLAAEKGDAGLAPALVRRLRGISPQMAREIAYRVSGDAAVTMSDLPAEAAMLLARETRAALEPLLTAAWAPRVYREQDSAGASATIAFAAVPLAHLAAVSQEEAIASISAAAEVASAAGAVAGPVRHTQRRERLLATVSDARARQARRLTSVQGQLQKAAAIDQLRTAGELIYAYLWKIEPGQATLDADGVMIALDPTLSGKENAQDYFERYRKAQGAGEHLPALAAEIEAELAYLDQLLTLIGHATSFAEIEALTAEWIAHGGTPPTENAKPSRRAASPRPRALHDSDGNAVLIGRSGAQNDQVTFDLAGPNDSWLHARGVPGSHVVIRWRHPSGDEDQETVEAAAALAAHYSSARDSGSVEVDVTRRRHVRKIKGTGPGMVTYRQERTISVRPADETALAPILHSE